MPTLNPNYLINIANLLLLAAFAVRDVLLLRTLFLAGSIFAIGYYYLQSPPLWVAIAWTVLYCAIHGYWVVRIMMERRPVVLTPDEETLYRLAFRSLDRRKFARLAGLGRWRNAEIGQVLAKDGEPVIDIFALISGKIVAQIGDKTIGHLGPGQLVGTAGVLLNNIQQCDFVVEAPGRYIAWPLAEAQRFMEKDPDLRSQFRAITSADLAAKLSVITHPMRKTSSSSRSGASGWVGT
jgi:hypothetical protein